MRGALVSSAARLIDLSPCLGELGSGPIAEVAAANEQDGCLRKLLGTWILGAVDVDYRVGEVSRCHGLDATWKGPVAGTGCSANQELRVVRTR